MYTTHAAYTYRAITQLHVVVQDVTIPSVWVAVGANIAKEFDLGVYFGRVTAVCKKRQLWHVVYEDIE